MKSTPTNTLVVLTGLPGTGKSFYTSRLTTPVIHLDSFGYMKEGLWLINSSKLNKVLKAGSNVSEGLLAEGTSANLAAVLNEASKLWDVTVIYMTRDHLELTEVYAQRGRDKSNLFHEQFVKLSHLGLVEMVSWAMTERMLLDVNTNDQVEVTNLNLSMHNTNWNLRYISAVLSGMIVTKENVNLTD